MQTTIPGRSPIALVSIPLSEKAILLLRHQRGPDS